MRLVISEGSRELWPTLPPSAVIASRSFERTPRTISPLRIKIMNWIEFNAKTPKPRYRCCQTRWRGFRQRHRGWLCGQNTATVMRRRRSFQRDRKMIFPLVTKTQNRQRHTNLCCIITWSKRRFGIYEPKSKNFCHQFSAGGVPKTVEEEEEALTVFEKWP